MSMSKRLAAEFIGTFWLVSAVCGSAVLAAAFPPAANGPFLGIGFAGIALAVGLSVVTGAYAVGGISGAHFNPAVTVGLVVGRRFPVSEMIQYIIAQVAGGVVGALVFFFIASGKPGFEAGGFASNGYGEHSPGGYSLIACFVTEVVMTAMFIFIILGATHKRAPNGFAGIAIGLALTLIHLMSIPVTGTSVNPARSTATAIFADSWALGQLWLFWVAPLIGAVIGALVYNFGVDEEPAEAPMVAQPKRMP